MAVVARMPARHALWHLQKQVERLRAEVDTLRRSVEDLRMTMETDRRLRQASPKIRRAMGVVLEHLPARRALIVTLLGSCVGL